MIDFYFNYQKVIQTLRTSTTLITVTLNYVFFYKLYWHIVLLEVFQ